MRQPARLITPQGKTIELPPEIYRQVKRLLSSQPRRQSRAQTDRAIRSTYGKYKGKSLTRALLAERTAERARENAKTLRRRA